MIVRRAKLALGTAQFGLAYGVAGRREAVPEKEIRAILERAIDHGVRRLDTATAYGDIEERLAGLVQGLDVEIISKIPALPIDVSEERAINFALDTFEQSRQRLGDKLRGVLFHNSADLREAHGRAVWAAVSEAAARAAIPLGVSCYAPNDLDGFEMLIGMAMVQLPGNALDQRFTSTTSTLRGVEISLRSIFLQGLMLMPIDAAVMHVPAATEALNRWHHWCETKELSPLVAALATVKAMQGVDYCIVGVDDAAQFDQIAEAWHSSPAIAAPELVTQDLDVIDPRRWVTIR